MLPDTSALEFVRGGVSEANLLVQPTDMVSEANRVRLRCPSCVRTRAYMRALTTPPTGGGGSVRARARLVAVLKS